MYVYKGNTSYVYNDNGDGASDDYCITLYKKTQRDLNCLLVLHVSYFVREKKTVL